MASNGVEVKGIEELFKDLDKMGDNGKKAQDKALKSGAKVFEGLMKAKAPRSGRDSAHLVDALKASSIKLDDAGNKYISIGTYLGGGKYRNGVYWGHIVEGGHFIISPSGKNIGYVSAKPFMEPAYQQGKERAKDEIAKIIFDAMGLK